MGIQGLLPALKSIMKPRHVGDYAGKRAAVDTYSWLHKAAFSCSKDLCQGRPNDKYVEYCMHRVNMLRHFGVHPVLVFDGGSLPMKADQEVKRARSRKENLERATEHERLGNYSAATECYQKAVDITPELAFRLIQVLRQENVEYVVAPYEADAQMAFLARHGHVDLVITEDSDLIAYACPQIFFKMDKYGQGVGFQFSDIAANKDIDFNNFSKRMILELCIMSGCDYLPSLPGMGVKKAHALIKRFKTYQKVLKHLKYSGVLIDQQYELGFQRAILTFQHHFVYDPAKKEMVHLTDVPYELNSDLDFLGPFLSPTIATAIAEGEVDPTTYEPFQGVGGCGIVNPDPNTEVIAASSNMQMEFSAQKIATFTNVSQGPGVSAKKQFRVPRVIPDSTTFSSCASPEETASQISSSSTTSSQPYPSPFSISSLTPEQSPVFETPPSQASPFVTEELDLDSGTPRTIDLTPECSPFYRKIHIFSEKQSDENEFPFSNRQATSMNVEVKTRKAFVPPLQQNAAGPHIGAINLCGQSSCARAGVVQSGYFSRPPLSKLLPTGLGVFSEDHSKRNTAEGSLWSTSTNTQYYEGVELADHTKYFQDINDCPAVEKKQGILKDITNSGQLHGIAAGKRKYTPNFHSDLLGERPLKSRSYSSVSHVHQFGSLAQRSMNEFMSSVAPFRCSQIGSQSSWPPSKFGTRASGLRAPSKPLLKNSSSRNDRETHPVLAHSSNDKAKIDSS